MTVRTAVIAMSLSAVIVACDDPPADSEPGSESAERISAEATEVPEPEPAPPPAEPVDLTRAVPIQISASSAYRDEVAQVERLFDGDLETSWNSRSDDLSGAWLELLVPNEVTVTSIEITAGFTKMSGTRDLFTGNHRVRRVRVDRNHQLVREQTLDVENRELQPIEIGQPGGLYRISLTEVVPGTNANWREACVSELRVMGTASTATAGAHTPTASLGALVMPAGSEAIAAGDPLDDGVEDDVDLGVGDDMGDEDLGDDGMDEGGGGSLGAGTEPSAGPELVEREGIHVTELVLAKAIESRRPVDPGVSFSRADTSRVYCYIRVANPDRVETSVFIGWEPVDRPTEELGREQSIQAHPEWVTFAFTGTTRRNGQYRCVVKEGDGTVLARAAFDLTD
jgi:hypothetical protein